MQQKYKTKILMLDDDFIGTDAAAPTGSRWSKKGPMHARSSCR